MIAESWTSWALIDPEQAVWETNETDNNQSTSLTWGDLPAVGGITITYTGSSTARIAWTYPIWVDVFNVYYDSNPYGSFTSLLGTTTNLYLDIALSTGPTFFLVKAVRNVPTR